jgi:hypothetical protein
MCRAGTGNQSSWPVTSEIQWARNLLGWGMNEWIPRIGAGHLLENVHLEEREGDWRIKLRETFERLATL